MSAHIKQITFFDELLDIIVRKINVDMGKCSKLPGTDTLSHKLHVNLNETQFVTYATSHNPLRSSIPRNYNVRVHCAKGSCCSITVCAQFW